MNRIPVLAVAFLISCSSFRFSASAEQFILHDDLCPWPVPPGVHLTSTGASFWEWRTGQNVPTNKEPVGWDEYGKLELKSEPVKATAK